MYFKWTSELVGNIKKNYTNFLNIIWVNLMYMLRKVNQPAIYRNLMFSP